jgi:hypothetical protein
MVAKTKSSVRYDILTTMTNTTALRDTLKMEAVSSFERPMNFYQARGRHIPNKSNLHEKFQPGVKHWPPSQSEYLQRDHCGIRIVGVGRKNH